MGKPNTPAVNAKPSAEVKPVVAAPVAATGAPEVEVDEKDPEDEEDAIEVLVDTKNIPLVINPETKTIQRGLKKKHFKEGIAKEDVKESKRRFLEYMVAVYKERLSDFDLSNDPEKKLELEIKKLEEKLAEKRKAAAAKK